MLNICIDYTSVEVNHMFKMIASILFYDISCKRFEVYLFSNRTKFPLIEVNRPLQLYPNLPKLIIRRECI